MVCEFYSKKLHSDSGCFLICLVALEAHMQNYYDNCCLLKHLNDE